MKPLRSLAAFAALAVVLSGCASTVALQPAEHAVDKQCATVVVALPDTLQDLPQRDTDAQGTSAWGDPASVILRCGVAVPGPTASLPCVDAGGVDWLRDDSKAPVYTFTTFGRDPATQVVIDQRKVSPGGALYELETSIAQIEPTGQCTSIEDSLGDGSVATTPAPTDVPTPPATPAN